MRVVDFDLADVQKVTNIDLPFHKFETMIWMLLYVRNWSQVYSNVRDK